MKTQEVPPAAIQELPTTTTREEPQPQVENPVHPAMTLEPTATIRKDKQSTTREESEHHNQRGAHPTKLRVEP